jgi:hypothetical protein
MTLALLFLDKQSIPEGGPPTATGPAFTPAVHHRRGVVQPDVPGVAGPGLAMWGWPKEASSHG